MNRAEKIEYLKRLQRQGRKHGGKEWYESDRAKQIDQQIRELEAATPTNAEVRRVLGPISR